MERKCLDCGNPHDFDIEMYCDCMLSAAIRDCRSDIFRNNNSIAEAGRSIIRFTEDNNTTAQEITQLENRLRTLTEAKGK